MPYKRMVDDFKAYFTTITFEKIPRDNNRAADAMATIASLVIMPSNAEHCEFLVEPLLEPAYNVPQIEMICLIVGPNSQWYGDIYAYLHDNTLPPDLSNKARKTFIHRAARYAILADTLYHRGLNGTLLRCLERDEANTALREVHKGICGAHSSGPTLAKKLLCNGYYWPTMERDAYQFVKKCKQCQIHGDLIHALAQEL